MGFLLQLQLDGLSFQGLFVTIRVLVCKPGLKLLVFAVEKSQDFADDVGRVGIKKLCVSVQVEFDVFLQADLERCSLRLL